MQVLSGGGSPAAAPAASLGGHSGHSVLPRAPSLTTVHEHAADGVPEQQAPAAQLQHQAAASPAGTLRPPRRCHSETALAGMQQGQGQVRPQWLAQLLHQPVRAEGWGLTSAASLQDIACRQLCATLVRQYGEQHGGRGLPPGLVQAVEAELRCDCPCRPVGPAPCARARPHARV